MQRGQSEGGCSEKMKVGHDTIHHRAIIQWNAKGTKKGWVQREDGEGSAAAGGEDMYEVDDGL
ncbi:hypothetical protein KFK09_008704 [Dendrobium nobile]|uniref:Uncharacterized protein n=1 Tax=Dendrobium nobile TaxID=94219 RepID=A0A8T3BPQ7_DENNO|nr:hypothetical protein KFK09_008704 [Dendrobium nobile]